MKISTVNEDQTKTISVKSLKHKILLLIVNTILDVCFFKQKIQKAIDMKCVSQVIFAHLGGAVEYTKCFFEEWVIPSPKVCPVYETKQYDGEFQIIQEL